MPLPPCQNCEAQETCPEQCKRGWLRDGGGGFGDYDLAIASLKIGDQDLVRAGVKRAAAACEETLAAAAAAAVSSTTAATPTRPPLAAATAAEAAITAASARAAP